MKWLIPLPLFGLFFLYWFTNQTPAISEKERIQLVKDEKLHEAFELYLNIPKATLPIVAEEKTPSLTSEEFLDEFRNSDEARKRVAMREVISEISKQQALDDGEKVADLERQLDLFKTEFPEAQD